MLDVQAIKPPDLKALSTAELAALAAQMLVHISEQSKHIDALDKRIDSQAQAIKWRDAKIESITFQLARLKAWKFGAKTEAMNAEQRDIFEETLAADQASLETQLAALQGTAKGASAPEKEPRRQPKREPLPEHLPRVEQCIEPEDTHCPTPECGQPVIRPFRLNSHLPSVNGAQAPSVTGIPAVALRTAASTPTATVSRASSANPASCQRATGRR